MAKKILVLDGEERELGNLVGMLGQNGYQPVVVLCLP